MPTRKLEQVREGDVLANAAANAQGVVLVPAGTSLSEKHLRLLKMWGVDVLQVTSPDAVDRTGDAVPKELLDQAEDVLGKCFGPSRDNEIMAEIFRVAVQQRVARTVVEEDV